MPDHEIERRRRVYAKRSGSQAACTLGAERGLPKIGAEGWELERYHLKRTRESRGGFDPCSLIR